MVQATADKYQLSESYQIAKSEVGHMHGIKMDYDKLLMTLRPIELAKSLSLLLNDDYEGGDLEVFPNKPMKPQRNDFFS